MADKSKNEPSTRSAEGDDSGKPASKSVPKVVEKVAQQDAPMIHSRAIELNPAIQAANEEELRRRVWSVAQAIVCANRFKSKFRIFLNQGKAALTGIFSILGGAGILVAKAEDFRDRSFWTIGWTAAIASLTILILLELYKALNLERSAAQAAAAHEAFSLLKQKCQWALNQRAAALVAMETVCTEAESLSMMFHMVLADPMDDNVQKDTAKLTDALLASARAGATTDRPISQQKIKPKSK